MIFGVKLKITQSSFVLRIVCLLIHLLIKARKELKLKNGMCHRKNIGVDHLHMFGNYGLVKMRTLLKIFL